jgi:uncharacterized Zn finger protein (UPF0148 family)
MEEIKSICKICNFVLEEHTTLCPVCGSEVFVKSPNEDFQKAKKISDELNNNIQ